MDRACGKNSSQAVWKGPCEPIGDGELFPWLTLDRGGEGKDGSSMVALDVQQEASGRERERDIEREGERERERGRETRREAGQGGKDRGVYVWWCGGGEKEMEEVWCANGRDTPRICMCVAGCAGIGENSMYRTQEEKEKNRDDNSNTKKKKKRKG